MSSVGKINPPMAASNFACCCADIYQLPITHFLLGESFHPGGVELTRQLANQCLIGRDSKVLDLACGRGATSLLLADEYACHVTAVDLGEENLAVLNQAAEDQNLSERITTVHSSVDELPFLDETFDAVICECALCTFTQPEIVLREVFRVTKPNARFGLSDIYLDQPLPDHLTGTLSRMICLAGARSIEDYQSLLQSNGFTKTRAKTVNWAMTQMLDRMEKQFALLDRINRNAVQPDDANPAQLSSEEFPWLNEAQETVDEVRNLCDSGGLGYVTITARG